MRISRGLAAVVLFWCCTVVVCGPKTESATLFPPLSLDHNDAHSKRATVDRINKYICVFFLISQKQPRFGLGMEKKIKIKSHWRTGETRTNERTYGTADRQSYHEWETSLDAVTAGSVYHRCVVSLPPTLCVCVHNYDNDDINTQLWWQAPPPPPPSRGRPANVFFSVPPG